jgi:transcriptional regulator with XRE-family HTH domain
LRERSALPHRLGRRGLSLRYQGLGFSRHPGVWCFCFVDAKELAMDDPVQRKELAAFLRSRREATDPVSMGLKTGQQRRTPGLRREELAQLSGVSVTWYTWLEQGRDISVSRKVIDSLARVLKISGTERAHLYTLAGLQVATSRIRSTPVDPTLAELVNVLAPNPASVINPWWDLLVFDDAYSDLLGDIKDIQGRNRIYCVSRSRQFGLQN